MQKSLFNLVVYFVASISFLSLSLCFDYIFHLIFWCKNLYFGCVFRCLYLCFWCKILWKSITEASYCPHKQNRRDQNFSVFLFFRSYIYLGSQLQNNPISGESYLISMLFNSYMYQFVSTSFLSKGKWVLNFDWFLLGLLWFCETPMYLDLTFWFYSLWLFSQFVLLNAHDFGLVHFC